MNGEYKNLSKGILGIVALMLLDILALNQASYYLGAGTAAFNLSILFVIAQTSVICLAYVFWYRRVSRIAAEMFNIEEMRRMAFHHKNRYQFVSLLLTGGISAAAMLCMVFNILFAGINAAYCYMAVFSMFFTGNLALWILMRFLGLPNRVTGTF